MVERQNACSSLCVIDNRILSSKLLCRAVAIAASWYCAVHQTFFICVGPTVPLLGLLLVLYNCFAVGPSPTDASPPLWLVAVKQQRYTLLIYAQYAAAR